MVNHAIAAFALSASLVRSSFSLKLALIPLIAFSLATSIGIAIGIGLASVNAAIDSVLTSLAAGTFIYISCTEILHREFCVKQAKQWL